MPPEHAYKRQRGSATPAVEQDQAAGGRELRMVALPGGRVARGSVCLRLYRRARRIRAYLRWSENGATRERYIGEVDQLTRHLNLELAWQRARSMGLLSTASLPANSTASTLDTRTVMRANRSKDTGPEMALRRMLHQRSLRYRVDTQPLPNLRRRADVVFPADRVAVFVDGCFWHGCPEHYRPSTRNAQFWHEKIDANRARDLDTNKRLEEAGWTVIRIWEHESADECAERIASLLRERRAANTVPNA